MGVELLLDEALALFGFAGNGGEGGEGGHNGCGEGKCGEGAGDEFHGFVALGSGGCGVSCGAFCDVCTVASLSELSWGRG